MEQRTEEILSPYRIFPRAEWARLRADTPMTLSPRKWAACVGARSPRHGARSRRSTCRSRACSRSTSRPTQRLFRAQQNFLGTEDSKVPYIIGVAGSVAVGKSTTARVLQALFARWPNTPRVDLVTTDGFLYPNAVLEREA